MHVSRQPNSGYKATHLFLYFWETWRLLWLDQSFWRRLTETETGPDWENNEMEEKQVASVRAWVRASLTLCEVRAWECESVRVCVGVWERGWGWGWGSESTDWFVWESEALFLNLVYLKLEFLRLGFTLVNRVLETRDLRGQNPCGVSTWNSSC